MNVEHGWLVRFLTGPSSVALSPYNNPKVKKERIDIMKSTSISQRLRVGGTWARGPTMAISPLIVAIERPSAPWSLRPPGRGGSRVSSHESGVGSAQ